MRNIHAYLFIDCYLTIKKYINSLCDVLDSKQSLNCAWLMRSL